MRLISETLEGYLNAVTVAGEGETRYNLAMPKGGLGVERGETALASSFGPQDSVQRNVTLRQNRESWLGQGSTPVLIPLEPCKAQDWQVQGTGVRKNMAPGGGRNWGEE